MSTHGIYRHRDSTGADETEIPVLAGLNILVLLIPRKWCIVALGSTYQSGSLERMTRVASNRSTSFNPFPTHFQPTSIPDWDSTPSIELSGDFLHPRGPRVLSLSSYWIAKHTVQHDPRCSSLAVNSHQNHRECAVTVATGKRTTVTAIRPTASTTHTLADKSQSESTEVHGCPTQSSSGAYGKREHHARLMTGGCPIWHSDPRNFDPYHGYH
ncbi:hypothetical protein DFH06DRAFT_1122204 [Mycena polygramma]|nr:hypothetical protein DFH06DRAFT_1122204 [Mycena polygramma]